MYHMLYVQSRKRFQGEEHFLKQLDLGRRKKSENINCHAPKKSARQTHEFDVR
jgi:hypothetical protein